MMPQRRDAESPTQMRSVTIIVTTLNSERYLARSIESCLAQTVTDFELVVVDGGSTDRTLEIVANYQQHDARIRVIHQHNNTGKLPGAINLGLENARGRFITWTQDDCWYEPWAIQTMMEYLETHPDIALVYTDYWDVDECGSRIRYQHAGSPDLVFTRDVIRVSFLLRREVYEGIGQQEPRHFPVHEVVWRAEVAKRYDIAPLHVPLMSYTVHSESLTGRIGHWDVARMSARALLETGGLDRGTYRRRLSNLEMDQGYTRLILDGDYRAYRRHFLVGLRLDLRGLTNLGLWKLYFISFTPFRATYRSCLLQEWQQRMDTGQLGPIQGSARPRGQ